MEVPNDLNKIFRLMKKLNNCEKYLALLPFSESLNLNVDFQNLCFTNDEEFCFPIPLDSICSVLEYESFLYILCKNNLLHIINLNQNQHLVKFVGKKPGFIRLFLCWLDFKVIELRNTIKKNRK